MNRLLLSATLVVAFLGCGEDEDKDEEPSFCESFSFEPCGGDVVGTWELGNACPAMTFTQEDSIDNEACTNAVLKAIGRLTQATVTLSSNGTYELATTNTLTLDIVIDEGCATALTEGAATLEEYCDGLEANLAEDFGTVVCSVSSGACRCNGNETSPGAETGTYTTANNELTLDPSDDPDNEVNAYCVEGDQLEVEVTNDEMTSVLVFSRGS